MTPVLDRLVMTTEGLQTNGSNFAFVVLALFQNVADSIGSAGRELTEASSEQTKTAQLSIARVRVTFVTPLGWISTESVGCGKHLSGPASTSILS